MLKTANQKPLADTYQPYMILTLEKTLNRHPDSWHTADEITQLIIKGRQIKDFQVKPLRYRVYASLQNLLEMNFIISEERRKKGANVIIKRYKINQ